LADGKREACQVKRQLRGPSAIGLSGLEKAKAVSVIGCEFAWLRNFGGCRRR
jgi:hypothetical protein